MKKKIDLIMDSGAFSAWTKKTEINLKEYTEFCLENLEHIAYVVNLDVIPGEPGQKRLSQDIIEESASKGWENFQYMLKKGIPLNKLIHVFHQGENFKWLDKIVKTAPYIGLSPANDRTTVEKIVWLDQCMPHVCDKKGMPIVKFHGFAVTSIPILYRYPWYSADSTTWCVHARNGAIMVPHIKNRKYIYNDKAMIINVSSKSPSRKETGKHFDTMQPLQQQQILDYLKLKGYEYDGVSNDYKLRDQLNIIYFLDFEKACPKWPWAFNLKQSAKGFGL